MYRLQYIASQLLRGSSCGGACAGVRRRVADRGRRWTGAQQALEELSSRAAWFRHVINYLTDLANKHLQACARG